MGIKLKDQKTSMQSEETDIALLLIRHEEIIINIKEMSAGSASGAHL
jgi:hypothetical protein